MNLAEIRQSMITLSGRFDIEEDINLANFFINQACRFLDRLAETQKTWASMYSYLDPLDWYIEVNECRAVKEVWASTTSARWQLEKLDIQDMLASYFTDTLANLSAGTPAYYCPAVTRIVPEGSTLPASITDYLDILSSSGQTYNAIIIAPSPDVRTLIDVKGFFYPKDLSLDTDSNFWTVTYPSTLLKAILREIEVFNRNSTGVNDWTSAIMVELDGINKDLVEEIISEVDQMEG